MTHGGPIYILQDVMTHVLMVTVEHLILITLKRNTINYLKRIVHTCHKNSLAHHNHPLQTYLQSNSISEKKCIFRTLICHNRLY